ncbi:MAG: hypothetical protein AB1414_01270 [bacterium]
MAFESFPTTKRAFGLPPMKVPKVSEEIISPTRATLREYGFDIKTSIPWWKNWGRKGGSVLKGVFRILRTGEYVMGGLLAGEGIIKGVREKISPSEAIGLVESEEKTPLWSKKGLAALVVDILLDPVTYLSFGTGGAVRITTTGGKIGLSKTGAKLIKKTMAKGISEGAAKREIAKLIQEGGEGIAKKLIAKDGLKFMGMQFVPRAPFTAAGRLIGKAPGIRTIKMGVSKAFKPFSEIEKLPTKWGGQGAYADELFKPFVKGTRAKINRAVQFSIRTAKEMRKKYGPEVGKHLAYKAEKGRLFNREVLDNILKIYRKEADEMLKLERATGKKIGEISHYVRHYITKEGRDFLDTGTNFFSVLPKPLRARLKSANPRKIEGTIKDINKFFKKKYKIKNFFEPDFFKAWALRKAEHIRYINTYNFLKATGAKFGIPIKKGMAQYTDEGIKLIKSTVPELKDVLLPQPIAEHIDEVQKVLTNEETMKTLLKGYFKVLSFWKGTVTGYWPAFHTRNYFGGWFNNWLAGINTPTKALRRTKQSRDILRGKDKIYKTKIGVKYTGNQIRDLAERLGVTGQPGMMDISQTIEEMLDTTLKGKLKKFWMGSGYPRWLMEQTENGLRMPLFLERLIQGDAPREAARWVFRYHFDYMPEGLTNFERLGMRAVFPFYVWTRHNIPLQIEHVLKNPGKYAGLAKTVDAISGEAGQKEFRYLPEWMKEMIVFRLPEPLQKEIGKSLWMQLDLPAEDLNKLPINPSGIREIAALLTPFLKVPAELFFNKHMYFGEEIWNPKLPPEAQTKEAVKQLKYLPNPIKKFLDFKEVYYRDWRYPKEKKFIKRYEMNAKKLHLLQSALSRFYFTFKGAFDPDLPLEWKATRYILGIPVRPTETEEEKKWREWEEETEAREYLRWLQQHGLIPYKGALLPSEVREKPFR